MIRSGGCEGHGRRLKLSWSSWNFSWICVLVYNPGIQQYPEETLFGPQGVPVLQNGLTVLSQSMNMQGYLDLTEAMISLSMPKWCFEGILQLSANVNLSGCRKKGERWFIRRCDFFPLVSVLCSLSQGLCLWPWIQAAWEWRISQLNSWISWHTVSVNTGWEKRSYSIMVFCEPAVFWCLAFVCLGLSGWVSTCSHVNDSVF